MGMSMGAAGYSAARRSEDKHISNINSVEMFYILLFFNTYLVKTLA